MFITHFKGSTRESRYFRQNQHCLRLSSTSCFYTLLFHQLNHLSYLSLRNIHHLQPLRLGSHDDPRSVFYVFHDIRTFSHKLLLPQHSCGQNCKNLSTGQYSVRITTNCVFELRSVLYENTFYEIFKTIKYLSKSQNMWEK